MSQEASVDTSDEYDGNKCECCHFRKIDTKPVSNLSQELISKIEEALSCKLNENQMICETCIAKYTLVVIPFKSKSEVPCRLHKDQCGYCGGTLLISKSERGTEVDDDSGDGDAGPSGAQDVGATKLSVDESREYQYHRHLTRNGCVPHDLISFVKFALRCYHRVHRRRLTLDSCLHNACNVILWKKYEASKKGDYYTPSKRKSATFVRPVCIVKSCDVVSVCSSEIIPRAFDALFASNRNEMTKVPMCNVHRLEYRRSLESKSFCVLCNDDLRRASQKDKQFPSKDVKIQLIEDNENFEFGYEVPDNFSDNDYELHRKCLKKFREKVRRAKREAESETETQLPKKRRLFKPEETGPSWQAGPSGQAGSSGQAGPSGQVTIQIGDHEAGPSFQQDIETGSVPSGHSSPTAATEDPSSLDDYVVVEPEIESQMSKTAIKDLVDDITVDFIQEELSKKCFITRKEVVNFWNDNLKTYGFQHNYSHMEMPTIRPSRVQKRIQEAWQRRYPDEEKELSFTFRSNKKGNISQ